MIKTPLSTVIGGAFWTPGATIIAATFEQRMKKLFANGEQGFWYDPNDLSTMFQDAGGTVPVTAVGQPVGLVLDKSKGLVLGGELNSNNFNTNLADWGVGTGASVILENGEAKATLGGAISATAGNWFKLNGNYNLGKRYTVSFDATYVSGGDLHAGFGYTVGLTVTAAQNGASKQRYTFTSSGIAATGSGLLAFGASTAGSVWKIDNVSVKEVTGNHAYQTTSSMRPLLTASPQRLDFDTVDDKLTTTLPAQLTGCTVIRAVPNVGTQILTNQTIPAPYNDNTDHCGLIVINRALTATETSQITKLFNKAAGV